MMIGVLGPFTVEDGERQVHLPNGRQRTVLATLVMSSNHVVRIEDLAATVWDGDPPPSAEVTLRNYIRRLRQNLGPAAAARLLTHPPGYVLRVEARELDLTRFEHLVEQADAAARAGSWALAHAELTRARDLWRGPLLADVRGETLRQRHGPWLRQLWLHAVDLHIDATLRLGRHHEALSDLRSLISEYPTHEPFHRHLMLALYRSGCQAEALEAYRRLRRLLIDTLAIEPSSEIRRLHERILSADPGLDAPPGRAGPAVRPEPADSPTRRTTCAGPHTADAARMLNLHSVHPGPDATAPALASLAALDLERARRTLDGLARARLVVEQTEGRYVFDRLPGAGTGSGADTRGREYGAQQQAALHRLLDHYLFTARAAAALLPAVRPPDALDGPCKGVSPELFTRPGQALDWFRAELDVLLRTIEQAAEAGYDVHARQLAAMVRAAVRAGL